MSILSPAMKREMSRSNPLLRYGVRFTFPDGDVEQISNVGWGSRSLGYFEPRVIEWGTIRNSVGDRRNAMDVANASGMRFLDYRNRWKTRDAAMDLRGTTVEYIYGSQRVDPGAWFDPRFRGVLLDYEIKDGVVLIKECGPPFLLQLRAPVPQKTLVIPDFLDLPDEAVDLWSAIGPWGHVDSYAFGNLRKGDNDGQLEPLYVGEYTERNLNGNEITGSKFLIGPGRIRRVVHVYKNEVKLAKDTTWGNQAIFEEINGYMWSRIQFNSNQSAHRITLDVEGYDYIGDGTGDLILDPLDQIVHFLTNFVFGRYRTGLWLPTSSLIDETLLQSARDYLTRRLPMGYGGGYYQEAGQDQRTAMEILNEWTESMEIKTFVTAEGKIGFGANSFDDAGYIDTPHVRRQQHVLRAGPLTPSRSSQEVAKRIAGETSFAHALGTFTERLGVISVQPQLEESADAISCAWGPQHL